MKNSLLILSISLLLLSCSNGEQSKRDALTTGTWKLSGYIIDQDQDGIYEKDLYAKFGECEKDNIYTFQADGNEIKDEGPTKCYDSAPQIVTKPWNFSDNATSLEFEGINYHIEELTPTTLRLQVSTFFFIFIWEDEIRTYTKQ